MRLQRSPCGVTRNVMVVFFTKVGLADTGLTNTEFGVFADQDFTMSEEHIKYFEENMQMLMLELDVEKLKEGLWSHQYVYCLLISGCGDVLWCCLCLRKVHCRARVGNHRGCEERRLEICSCCGKTSVYWGGWQSCPFCELGFYI